jgi:hypothetical protein
MSHRTALPLLILAALGALAACGGGGADAPDPAPVNHPPVARAGADRAATTLEEVTLDGTASDDQDGDPLSYQWTLTGRPGGSAAALTSATTATPSLVPDVPGEYLLALAVDDGQATSQADAVIVTAAASWKAPRALDDGAADLLAADMNGAGAAVAVWRFSGAAGSGYRAAHYDLQSDQWGAPVELLAPTPSGGDAPRVAVGSGGDAVAAWAMLVGGLIDYWACTFDAASGTWSTPASITTGATLGYGGPPRVAVNAAGQALVVWSEYDGSVYDVWASAFDPAVGWGAPARLEAGGGDASNGRVALDDAGRGVAIWIQGPDSLSYRLWASSFDFQSGAWSAAQQIDPTSGPGLLSLAPSLAMSPSGLAVAAWTVEAVDLGQRQNVWTLRYDAGTGSWSEGQEVDGTDETSSAPVVAVDDSGTAVVVWWQYDGAWNRVGSTARALGQPQWEAATHLDEGGRYCGPPTVGVDGAGNAVAAWVENDGTVNDLRAAFRDLAGGGWHGPGLVAARITGFYEAPWADASGATRAVAAWRPGGVVTYR